LAALDLTRAGAGPGVALVPLAAARAAATRVGAALAALLDALDALAGHRVLLGHPLVARLADGLVVAHLLPHLPGAVLVAGLVALLVGGAADVLVVGLAHRLAHLVAALAVAGLLDRAADRLALLAAVLLADLLLDAVAGLVAVLLVDRLADGVAALLHARLG